MNFLTKTRPNKKSRVNLTVLPLHQPLLFPGNGIPFFLTERDSIHAVEVALGDTKEIIIIPPKDNSATGELEKVGTVARIQQTLKMPDGSVRVMVEPLARAVLIKLQFTATHLRAEMETISPQFDLTPQTAALMQTIIGTLQDSKDIQKKIPKDKLKNILQAETPDSLVDALAPFLSVSEEKKKELYVTLDPILRLEELAVSIRLEAELLRLNLDIGKRVKGRMDRNQKEYYLNEQMREIQKELGQEDGDPTGAAELKKKIEELSLSDEIREKCLKEASRLSKLQPTTPEAGILRNYLEWITDLPWNKRSDDHMEIAAASKILDEDHYDMKKAKDRILDFLAVSALQEKLKGPILCLLGPPGTGKTSLGRSVARAIGRSFVRISLGGVRDEAEIRGHRKTYVGALPGRIIQGMKRAGTSNPVFLLDEIDKLSSDYRGDPSAALLEVLDPEQNKNFSDHYLEVPYDLSEVLFITTANSIHTLTRPLLDRLEVIEVPGYTSLEKLRIAQDFLIPKQRMENGLGQFEVSFEDTAVKDIVDLYTSESGVRGLERNIAQALRKTARKILEDHPELGRRETIVAEEVAETPVLPPIVIDSKRIREALGQPLLRPEALMPEQRPGVAAGLAWTESGGRVLPVEVTLFPGKGELVLTGSLGDVMKESARIALSFIKSHAALLGIEPSKLEGRDVHIHFPEGAIPKDGPSAGVAMASALCSAIKEIPLRSGTAMTGEITLTGKVLPIGGLKEKLLAAHRQKLYQVILPAENKPQMEDIPAEITDDLHIHWVKTAVEAFDILFEEEGHDESHAGPVPA